MSELRRAIVLAAVVAVACAAAYRLSPDLRWAMATGNATEADPIATAAAWVVAPTVSEVAPVAAPGLAPPLAAGLRVTSGYGVRRSPLTARHQFHAGVDLAAPAGTPVLAAADGTVVAAGWYSQQRSSSWWAHGRLVVLEHDGGAVSLYAHLSRVDVLSGTFVAQGEQLGLAGSTGATTGPHLHFEVRLPAPGGQLWPTNPLLYITASDAISGVAAAGAPSGPQIPGGGVQSGRVSGQSAPPGRAVVATGEAGRRSAAD